MKRTTENILLVVTISAIITFSGCQTTGDTQNKAAGAGIGALLGCAVGALTNDEDRGKGCAVGAAVGAAAGWATVSIKKYQSERVRSRANDRRVYGLTKSVRSPQVKINKSSNSPRTAKIGQTVNILTDYSVRLPRSESAVSVKESWTLKKNGKAVTSLPAQTNEREDGGWAAKAEISIPAGIAPGTYMIEHRVQASSSYDTSTSQFVVKS